MCKNIKIYKYFDCKKFKLNNFSFELKKIKYELKCDLKIYYKKL